MDVDSAAVAIRPRNPWQAMDLGFQMARHWFVPLWILWIATAGPLCLLLSLVLFKHWVLLSLIIWWFKPLYELPQLYFLSRAIFGEQRGLKSIFVDYLRIVRPVAPALLTWRRFSMARSFENPVLMLEGLTGTARRERLRILKQEAGDKCQWLTVVCYHFEFLLYFSIIILARYLIPNEPAQPHLLAVLTKDASLTALMTPVLYTIAMSVIAPFYTAAGFGMYLSRRTLLECWDIELNFKRLASRLVAARAVQCIAAVALCLATLTLPGIAQAETPAKVRAVVTAVAADKAFGKMEQHYVWRFKKTEEKASDKQTFLDRVLKVLGDVFKWTAQLLRMLAPLLEALAWFALIVILLLAVRKFEPWRRWQGLQRSGGEQLGRRPTQILGLDISEASLPADVVAEVRRLLQQGETRAALSLLYRGSLWRLVNWRNLQIDEGCTEGECVRLVQAACPAAEAEYFRQLTRCWCRLAYAHESPPAGQLEMLSGDWGQYYGAESD